MAPESSAGPDRPGDGTPPHVDAPEVTVVIPTRNRVDLLPLAIASVRRQKGVRWELVVVDNASGDGTPALLEQAAGPDLRVVRHAVDRERCASRNSGLAVARAAFVLFLDDDDQLRSDGLVRLTRALERHRTAVAAVGGMTTFNEDGYRRRVSHPVVAVRRRVWREVVAGWVAYPSQTLYRTDVLRSAGGWSEAHVGLEDQELLLRLSRVGPVAMVPGTVVDYRESSANRGGAAHEARERELREAHLAQLPARQRARARRLARARRHLDAAGAAFQAHEALTAAAEMVHAIRVAPVLLASPIIGPILVINLGKGALTAWMPRRAVVLLRAGVHRLRTRGPASRPPEARS